MSDIIKQFNENVMSTYGRYDVVVKNGKNHLAEDENGKKYIDFGSGIGTNSLGYCNDAWVDAVCSQAKAIQHTSNYYYTKVQAEYAKKLCETTTYSKVFFGNSGAEANECAIKLARKYSFDKYGEGRNKIITLVNSFHGRTIATLSATGQDVFHNYFFPFVEGFDFAKANDIVNLKEKIDDNTCAIMIEFIQGEGGVVPLDKAFVNQIAEICEQKDILFIADEVQTGVGRTGAFLASQKYGVKPNVTTLAKGIAGGLPMGACLADEKTKDVLGKSSHGSTFGGNPICCSAANAVIDTILKDNFLDEVAKKGEYFKKKLLSFENVISVDGDGLMIGITFKNGELTAADVAKMALDNGLFVLTAKEKVRLLPPLTITFDEIDEGLAILEKLFNN